MNWIIFWIILLSIFIWFNGFLIYYDRKLKRLEAQIILLFEKRTNLVPSLFEISKKYLNKHWDVFTEILKLRKIEFTIYHEKFLQRIQNETAIHHELNFIFQVCNKHPQIQKDGRFLLIRDLFIENSHKIGTQVGIYKNVISLLNILIVWKNFTIIWIFIPIEARTPI